MAKNKHNKQKSKDKNKGQGTLALVTSKLANMVNKDKKPAVTVTPYVPKISLIKDCTSSKNTGVILLDQRTVEEIQKNSGPLTNGNEYQVHYHALVIRFKAPDNSILDICIPTVFFNYKQQVSAAHIDFELSDVDNASEPLFPVHNVYANKLLATPLIDHIKALIPNIEAEIIYTNLNSIHKHPGGSGSQSFSGTDLKKDHTTDTGIVFPLSSAENDKPNFAGIMAHDFNVNHIAHFEYRTVNGTVNAETKTPIKYTKGRCIAYVKDKPTTISGIEALLGIPITDPSYKKLNNATFYPLVERITALWHQSEFLPATQFIDPKNITKKVTTSYYGGYYGNTYKPPVNTAPITPTLIISEKYINTCKAIEWKTEDELRALQNPDVLQETLKVSQIYYGDDVMGDLIDLSKEDLIEDYLDTQKFIYQEIADYELANKAEKKENEKSLERELMETQLLNNGFTQKTLDLSSLSQLNTWCDRFIDI